MSLINQALRKVQSERSANKNTLGSDSPSAPYVYQKNNKTIILIGLSVSIVVLIGLVAGLAFLLLFKSSEPTIVEVSNSETLSSADTTVELSSGPETKPLGTTLPLMTPDSQEKPLEEETSVINEPEALMAKPDQKIIQWLAESNVSGMRISRKGSKVILNNKAYTVGEIVNFDFELKLLQIEENKLLFVDPDGAEYTKGF